MKIGTAPAQLDLFDPPSPLASCDPIPARSAEASPQPSAPARRILPRSFAQCPRFVAWLPKAENDFINSVVTEFGRRTEPIVLRSGRQSDAKTESV
jgi:hypothetical protein